jgi:hypothetical protein
VPGLHRSVMTGRSMRFSCVSHVRVTIFMQGADARVGSALGSSQRARKGKGNIELRYICLGGKNCERSCITVVEESVDHMYGLYHIGRVVQSHCKICFHKCGSMQDIYRAQCFLDPSTEASVRRRGSNFVQQLSLDSSRSQYQSNEANKA